MLSRLERYFHTLRHLKPTQWLHRVDRLVRTRPELARWYGPPSPIPAGESGGVPEPLALEAEKVPEMADPYLHGDFEFAGRLVQTPAVEWDHVPEGDLLWTFNLHYFEWAEDLARAWRATGSRPWSDRALGWMVDWIEHNPLPEGPGWHPYPTSRRLVAWSKVLAATRGAPRWAEAAPEILGSIDQQVRYLADWPERDLQGNHLLANLHAVAWITLHLGESLPAETRRKIRPFVAEACDEYLRQTRPDGSHEENSTSYQLVVLKDLFELHLLARRLGHPLPSEVDERLEAMFEYTMSLVRPDGKLPLLNDAVRGYPMEVGALLAAGAAEFKRGDWAWVASDPDLLGGPPDLDYLRWTLGTRGAERFRRLEATPPRRETFGHRDAGYYVLRDGWGSDEDYLVFDCGPIGPDHIPGHAHADTLQVVLWVDGAPLFVDPGVYTYRPGRWRDWFRSTAAHNTVTVDRQDSSEVWSAFRVARRARARLHDWDAGGHVAGSHDGYERLEEPVTHRRAVHRREEGWEIVDTVTASAGGHQCEASFQLPPDTEVKLSERAAEILRPGASDVALEFEGPQTELVIKEGWVAERWRQKEAAPRLVVRFEAQRGSSELRTVVVRQDVSS